MRAQGGAERERRGGSLVTLGWVWALSARDFVLTPLRPKAKKDQGAVGRGLFYQNRHE